MEGGRGPLALATVLAALLLMAPPGVQSQDEAAPGPAEESAPPATDDSATPAETEPAPEAEPQDASEAAPAEPTGDLATIPVDQPPEPAPPAGGEAAVLDEITVTAQKRGLEVIKDVPISISVVDEHAIAEWGIANVREVMFYVPNVKVEDAGFIMLPRIRGFITNNNNKAFEPPAGVAIDGIPYGRVEYFNAGLFDVGRVEVLRGPQGTTFGKNTTAGLIHILSKDPSKEFGGYVDLLYGEFNQERLEFGVGGAVVDDFLNVRVAGLKDTRRGYLTNTTAAIEPAAEPFHHGRDNSGMRIKFHFPDLLATSLKISYESVELGSIGAGAEAFRYTQAFKDTLLRYDPNADFEPGNNVVSLDSPDFRRTKINTWTGEWAYPVGAWNLTALGGYSDMRSPWAIDGDFTPANAIIADGYDRVPTTTIELRTLSPSFRGLFGLADLFGADLGDSDILVGIFSQQFAIKDGYYHFRFPNGPLLELAAASTADQTPPPAPPNDAVDEVMQKMGQDSETIAVFSQIQWHFLPEWALHLGGRYSVEEKSAFWDQRFQSPPPNSLATASGFREFSATRQREDKFFQPKVSLNWQPWGDLSLFLHWARSFKAGGYNAFSFRNVEDQLTFDPEYSTELGFDVRGSLLANTLRYNVSLYQMEIEDFQVLTRLQVQGTVGLGISKVENAKKARAQGLEGDVTWLVAEWLRLVTTIGLNDTEYIDFLVNECPADRANQDGDSEPRCNANGKPFAFAPKINGSVIWHLTSPWSFAGGITPSLGIGGEYASEQYLDVDLDERKQGAAYWRWRASIGLVDDARGWSFKLVGENLTDEVTYLRMGDAFARQFVDLPDTPRRVFGQLRWSF
jgi:outer membrane receptor protein involved in Fe transport